MFCMNCGNQIEDDAKFCGYCGAPTEQKKVCPSCGREMGEQMIYCSFCGTKVDASKTGSGAPKATGMTTVQQNTQNIYNPTPGTYYQSEGKLKTADVTWYKKEVKIGFSEAAGTLTVYRNRLELKKTMGSNKSYVFAGVIGMAISASKAKGEAPVIFPMNQIANVREGQYGIGKQKKMVLEMKNGEEHMFIGKEKDIQDCITLVKANIK